MARNNDVTVGSVLAAFSLVYLALATRIKVFTGPGRAPLSARFIPLLFGGALLLVSLLLILRGVRQNRDRTEKKRERRSPKQAIGDDLEVILTFIALTLYLALMRPLGFIIDSVLFVVGEAIILTPPTERKSRRLFVTALVLAVVLAVAADYVFSDIFHVMLPKGLLGF